MSEEYLPSRFKHSNVDRFLPYIVRLTQGANEVRINHLDLGLNANTCEHRVRDAVLAILSGKTFYPDLNTDRLREIWPLYKVRREELTREIVIELRHKESPIMSGNFLDAELSVAHPHFEEVLIAYAILYNHEVYKGRLHIIGLLSPDARDKITMDYPRVYFTQVTPMEHYLS